MIYISSAAMQNDIIELLEKSEADIKFKYVSKQGIKLAFETDTDNDDLAVNTAKAIIKASDLGKALYFQVSK